MTLLTIGGGASGTTTPFLLDQLYEQHHGKSLRGCSAEVGVLEPLVSSVTVIV
jgi:hypothetical protein